LPTSRDVGAGDRGRGRGEGQEARSDEAREQVGGAPEEGATMTAEKIRGYMQTTENGLAREKDLEKFSREIELRKVLALFEIAAQLAEMNERRGDEKSL
jgi:hypothetical protein